MKKAKSQEKHISHLSNLSIQDIETVGKICKFAFRKNYIMHPLKGFFMSHVNLIDVLTIFQRKQFNNVDKTKFHFCD